MKNSIWLVVAVSILLSVVSIVPAKTPLIAIKEKPAAMDNTFATDLYTQLAPKEGNLFFSPTSIQTALAMTWAGARGATAEEMGKTLHLDPNSHDRFGVFLDQINADGQKGGYELSIANALWCAKAYPFRPEYLKLVAEKYKGHPAELNFAADPEAARQTINDWVATETRNRIKDLLPQNTVKRDTRLVLTNAIYFKGKWDLPFEKNQTKDDNFFTSDGKKLKAPLMYQQAHFRYADDDAVQVLELPYGKNDLAMRIYLPKEGTALPALEKKINAKYLQDLAGKLRREDVRVWLPKFTMECEFGLKDKLEAMGMKLAFSDKADFSGMTTAESLFISAVIHKAFVKVDEEGTEAAAATGIVMAPTAMPMNPAEPKVFRADHPFIFAIVHQKTDAILFMGRVANP